MIVAEKYRQAFGWGPSIPNISWSMAKSITSALVGMRIQDGGLSLDDVLEGPYWSPEETASRNITGDCPSVVWATLAAGLHQRFKWSSELVSFYQTHSSALSPRLVVMPTDTLLITMYAPSGKHRDSCTLLRG